MTRELLLLRHGKSDWNTGTDDYHRPLKDRGKRGAQRLGVWLRQQGLVPDHVVSSPAERAIVTAEKVCKVMGMGSKGIRKDKTLYAATRGELLQTLANCPPQAQRVMLVGHNPGLEELLVYLADEPIPMPEDGKLLPTATLARLAMPDDWGNLHAGSASLLSIMRPGGLPKKFPFPTVDGPERRDRPAYYYTQSSVIPYRWHDGKLEILIISSSKQKHWVVPKGIKDPGVSAQDSAAKEAWEEAGIEGRVVESAIGNYVYEKWGASCTVDVYPMEVTRMLPEKEWEERHRGREWVSPEQAQQRLRQDELKPMISALVTLLREQ
jgi:phosphohistidine phosphatase